MSQPSSPAQAYRAEADRIDQLLVSHRTARTPELYRRVWDAGKCTVADPESWFPTEPQPNVRTTAQARGVYERHARLLCRGCEVVGQCLELALREEAEISARNLFGIRGGLAPWERARLIAARKSDSWEGVA